ncbi:thioredoxin family protein [Microbacterium sp. W4I4]|uniref:thioredoxin family protein n=1 Tax=Microbacterium sp. W4I4 TaxID=3042295 RepID=UPI0027D87AF0|nr:thioredoxin family protein [Microbacterium sp. W4I4]
MPLSSALIALAALVAVAVITGVIWRVRDGRRRSGSGAIDPADLGVTSGRISLVQFSTETCTRCPQVRRMLQGIAAGHDGVDHIDVDLTHRPDLARRHRVLSTPTTFLIGTDDTLIARFNGAPRRADIESALTGLPAFQEAS